MEMTTPPWVVLGEERSGAGDGCGGGGGRRLL